MPNQLNLFDFTPPELACTANAEIGSWTFADLRKWAESIVSGWKVEPYGKTKENIICKRNKREINLHLGRVWKFDTEKYVPAIHFDWWDAKKQSGGGCAYDDVAKCEERVRLRAREFGWI